MNATPAPTTVEADDVLIARADQRLAHAYDQIARADEQLARVTEKLSKLEHDGGDHALDVLDRQPSRGRWALRGFIGLLLSACVIVAALAWQTSYGDAAKPIIAQWAPRFMLVSSTQLERPELVTQPSPSTLRVATPGPISPQPTATAQAAPEEVASTSAPMPPELAQLLETMARDLAQVEQGIEQLKTRQEQMASDNIKLVDQLKANQEQMTYLIGKASEQSLQPKISPVLPKPITTATRKPVSAPPSLKRRVHPQAPVQLQPDDQ
jgi:hypothetical protein